MPVQVGLQLLVLALQEEDDLIQEAPVFLGRHPAGTGCQAAADMKIQAGPALAPPIGAGAQGKEFIGQLQGVVDHPGIGIGPEIAGLVPAHLAHHFQAGKVVFQIQLDIGIVLIILEAYIVPGTVLFDELALQEQSLHLGGGEDIIQIHGSALMALTLACSRQRPH